MVKKLKQMAAKQQNSGAGLFDSALADSIKASAKEIWLAGMGAFAKAQAEGKQVFEALVKEGSSLQRKTQGVAEERFSEVTNKMTSMADEVTAKANQQWDKLETIFEERTARALKKLGVPTSKDVQALIDRVDALSAQVASRAKTAAKSAARSAAKTASAKAAPARKAASAKSAAKRAPRKSAA